MPSPASPLHSAARPAQAMPLGAWSPGEAARPSSQAAPCERAVRAIWRRLDEHDLVDAHVRDELATVLEALTALPLGNRPQRLIGVLRQPDPLDPSHLYWLTRRLLTLVPELQAIARAGQEPAGALRRDMPIDAIDAYQPLD
ncbi:hypothetical protein VAR608DRAFT_2472 [Variovorax sp. HW608]|uniref:hypothetical protein n=1 Tax=Variovorax sp. HW608 TaxID=1034889 RepID=UPI00081FA2BA|nr:hypothetical protein [Variovorax sp. HW608]SCK29425.1 hypothetical protein VAR608DRAFT_2472 [Variovorax sp. HW608]